jgi:MFS family permease
VHTVGELWHSAAGFEVSYALAPEQATGQYLGVFGLGAGLAEAVGPALLIGLCISWGRPGWYVVGVLFLATGLVTPAAVRWARPPERVMLDRRGPGGVRPGVAIAPSAAVADLPHRAGRIGRRLGTQESHN